MRTNGRCSRRVKLPDGKVLIPGVIESKSNFIEHPELIAQRIGRYANLVGRENVIAGSDCGYGTWVGQAAVDPDVVWAKLAAMAEGARIASRSSGIELGLASSEEKGTPRQLYSLLAIRYSLHHRGSMASRTARKRG